MSSKFGMPPGQQTRRAPATFDISQAKDVTCDNCGNYTFQNVFFVKFVSKIINPSGEDGLLPIQSMACNSCGNVNNEFLPPYLRNTDVGVSAVTSSVEAPSSSKIEIIK